MLNIAELQQLITHLHEKYRDLDEGEVATYIPELGKANPDHFGICVYTVEGQEISIGDTGVEYTIQSICKPLAFAYALEDLGRDKTLMHVGVEPSGDSFNSIELDPVSRRPYNPMVNAGAIAVASLIKGENPEAGVGRFLERLCKATDRNLRVDQAVLQSETLTGSRNKAIAYLMHNFGVIDTEIEHTLHQYFSQCSVLVNTRDLALMAASIANLGENPVTGAEAFSVQYTRDVLATLFTCGMYNYAGEWAYRVGVPAKSGVSGGIMGVVNREAGIAVYSPRLDARGNSVRGIAVFRELAEECGLHAFDVFA